MVREKNEGEKNKGSTDEMQAPDAPFTFDDGLDIYFAAIPSSDDLDDLRDPTTLVHMLFEPPSALADVPTQSTFMRGHRNQTEAFHNANDDTHAITIFNENPSTPGNTYYQLGYVQAPAVHHQSWVQLCYNSNVNNTAWSLSDTCQQASTPYDGPSKYVPMLDSRSPPPANKSHCARTNTNHESLDSATTWDACLDNFSIDEFGLSQIAACDLDALVQSLEDPEEPDASKCAMHTPTEETESIESASSTFSLSEWLIWLSDDGKTRRPHLHEFLRLLLDNPAYSHIARYVDKSKGIFKFHERHQAASLWQQVKGRNSDSKMTYDKLARGIRYYYPSNIMRQSSGRFTFRFGPGSGFGHSWLPVALRT